MIKRDGVTLMNARTQNVSVAKEMLEVLKQKQYTSVNGKVVDISDSLQSAINDSVFYTENDALFHNDLARFPKVEVTDETTAQAAERLISQGKDVVALNFASARNPGGGFLAGAIAQEEDLCRSSGLYVCIKNKPLFYNANILCEDTFYTNGAIYSPKVPFIKDVQGNFIDNPFLVSIITMPAPNLSSLKKEDFSDLLKGLLRERAIRILSIAADHNHKNIILGAWGCGAYGNDPLIVAESFKLALENVPAFENVCFAVYDNRPGQPIFNIFKDVFKS